MAIFKKSKKRQLFENRHKRLEEQKVSTDLFPRIFKTSRILKIIFFFVFTLSVILICFVGQFPSGLQILPNQIAKVRVVADFPFTYESQIKKKRIEDSLRRREQHVYQRNNEYFETFQKNISELENELVGIENRIKDMSLEERKVYIDQVFEQYAARTGISIDSEGLNLLLNESATSINKNFTEGMVSVEDILRDGILLPFEVGAPDDEQEAHFPGIKIEGQFGLGRYRTVEKAKQELRRQMTSMGMSRRLTGVYFEIFENGIQPNLIYDEEKTEDNVKKKLDIMGGYKVHVTEGQTIIEPGSSVGPEQLEQLKEYQANRKKQEVWFGFNRTLWERASLTFAILFTTVLYIRVGLPSFGTSTRRIVLAAIAMLFNLSLIRLLLSIEGTSFFESSPDALFVLPFCAPMALGSIITAIMLGPRPAILVAVLINIFYAMMLGIGAGFSLAGILASVVAICFCQNIRLRSQVIRTGLVSGVVVALSAIAVGIMTVSHWSVILYGILASILTGIITGFITIGVLPYLESLFHIITDITLLELTDYNHPLLRRMQMHAPGTYHHSLMVANLAERGALEIGANPLLCRACALYHDVGKIVKPEYFIENQRENQDPHLERNPSMSALVIKSHVKEGIILAKKYRLPKVIIDVIMQHHGTTLIQYFYEKALKQKRQAQLPLEGAYGDLQDETMEESTFRYDGPVPQFKESAIIMLADSVEAASRSLRKPSAVAIDDLIDTIFKEKLNDHQLDECPLTFQEIQLIKRSFSFTLLNMLHTRVEYPEKQTGPQFSIPQYPS